jgi:transcriptional regulator with XRE-family HTH domain
MVNASDFAKRLQKILDYYGLSATAFSEEIQFNRSTISHLLSGRNKPSLEFVLKVLQKFPEVELYWLLNGKGTFPASQNKETLLVEEKKNNLEPNLFEQENKSQNYESKIATTKSTISKNIERIVIFFEDGTFKEYSQNL